MLEYSNSGCMNISFKTVCVYPYLTVSTLTISDPVITQLIKLSLSLLQFYPFSGYSQLLKMLSQTCELTPTFTEQKQAKSPIRTGCDV